MRSHLLHDQDRQPVQDPELLRHRIRRRVRSDCKLTERKHLMTIHDPLHDQTMTGLEVHCSVLLEIVADRRNHTPVLKLHQEIPVLDIADIDRPDIQDPIRSGKLRGSKHLAERNIHIRHAVLKLRLLLRIRKSSKLYLHVRPVLSLSDNLHILRGVEHIDDLLLHIPVQLIIQRVDPDRLLKDLRELLSDRRYRECDDRKTRLVTRDILVHDRHGKIPVFQIKILLFLRKRPRLRLVHRLKSRLTERLDDRRSRIDSRVLLILFIRRLQNADLPVTERLVHIDCAVIPVIIVVLSVRGRRCIAAAPRRIPVDATDRTSREDHGKTCCLEILHRLANHTLHSDRIPDCRRFLLCEITSHDLKSADISVCIGIRHLPDLFLRQAV